MGRTWGPPDIYVISFLLQKMEVHSDRYMAEKQT